MCYAALAEADLQALLREYAAVVNTEAFAQAFWERANRPRSKVKFPIAIDRYFLGRSAPEESAIREAIAAFRTQKIPEWEAAMFEQRKRNANAQRLMAKKLTKKAAEDFRISQKKVDQFMHWLDEFKRN